MLVILNTQNAENLGFDDTTVSSNFIFQPEGKFYSYMHIGSTVWSGVFLFNLIKQIGCTYS